jgi:hypothetical protein
MANCFDIIKKYLNDKDISLTPVELLNLENIYLKEQAAVQERGLSFLDIITDPLNPEKQIRVVDDFNRRALADIINKKIKQNIEKFRDKQIFDGLVRKIEPDSPQMKYLEKYYPTEETLMQKLDKDLTGVKLEKEILKIKEKAGANASRRKLISFSSLLMQTNDTFGHMSFEGQLQTDTRSLTGTLLTRLQDNLKKAGLEKEANGDLAGLFITDSKRLESVITELFHKYKSGFDYQFNGITDDKIANVLAHTIVEMGQSAYLKKVSLGVKNAKLHDARPQIVFKYYKMKGELGPIRKIKDQVTGQETPRGFFDADDFAAYFSERMSDSHGTMQDKIDISKKFYERFMLNNVHDWRVMGAVIKEHAETRKSIVEQERIDSNGKMSKKEYDKKISEIPNELEYKDGKSFIEVNNRLGDNLALSELVHGLIREEGRELAKVKFFGTDAESNFQKLVNLFKTGKEDPGSSAPINENFYTNNFSGGTWYDRSIAKYAEANTNYILHPWKEETAHASPISTFLTAARNLEVVKLGSGVITQLGDLSTFLAAGWGKIATSPSKLVDTFFGYNRVTKNFSLAERQKYNSMALDFLDVFHGSHQDRFRMIDYSGQSANTWMGDKLVRGTAYTADKTLRWTLFSGWNRNLSSGAAGLVYREIGEMLSKNKLWIDAKDPKNKNIKINDEIHLKPEQQEMLLQAGIDQTKYDIIIKNRTELLDGNGRLNPFSFEQIRSADAAAIKDTIGPQLLNLVNNMVERMVIKPSALDRGLAGFFAKPGSVTEQFFRGITQFKTFTIALSRKLLIGDWSRIINGPTNEKIASAKRLAVLYATMYPIALAVIQLKQWVAGKEAYDMDTAMLRAFQYTNILPFMGDMYWDNGGKDAYAALFGDDSAKKATGVNFQNYVLGPVLSDITNLMTGIGKLATGGVYKIAGNDQDAEKRFNSGVGTITKTIQGLDPFANIVYTKAVWRATTYDQWLEQLDPKAYKAQQKRMEDAAKDERTNGQLYMFDRKLLNGE